MQTFRDATIDDCDALGLVTVSASHSAFTGVIPEPLIDFSWTPEVSAQNWRCSFGENTDRQQQMLVAEEHKQVIGFIWTKPWSDMPGYDACVQGLYVLPTRQRRGLGRQLFQLGAAQLMQAGAMSFELGCVADNPSCAFYRRFGGEEVGRRKVSVDRYDTEEIIFGWQDIAALL